MWVLKSYIFGSTLEAMSQNQRSYLEELLCHVPRSQVTSRNAAVSFVSHEILDISLLFSLIGDPNTDHPQSPLTHALNNLDLTLNISSTQHSIANPCPTTT